MKKELQNPQFISTILIKEIVGILKNPPFNENLTLISFDEKDEKELFSLMVRVLEMIDKEIMENKDQNRALFEFLKSVEFPYGNEKQLEEDINHSDKKLFIQILHFMLTRINELKKKYYLSKYVSQIQIPDEFTGDEEITDLLYKYKQYQSEFHATYEMIEDLRNKCPPVKELREDIKKLESDKLQLNNKIQIFKKTNQNKPDFQPLFEITSKLRKEQEDDSNLEKKLVKQQNDIDELEERILLGKQRYVEATRSLNENISAYELLENLRNQRNINRDTLDQLSKYEINEKRNKLKSLEEIISMPEITRDDVNKIKSEVKNAQNNIERLENKIKNSSSKSSELTVYKTNAMNAANLRDSAMKILKNQENEKNLLERKYADLEKKFEVSKGFKFVRKDDLIQKAENMKKKKEIFTKFSKIIDGFTGEGFVLDKTIKLLKSKSDDYEAILQKLEQKQGISGFKDTKKELEELSKKKMEIDQSKATTLEEYSKLVLQLEKKIKDSEEKLKPQVEKLNKVKQEYETILPNYNQKKNSYEISISDFQSKYNNVKEEYLSLDSEYKSKQSQYHSLNISLKYNDDMVKRYEAENYFISKPDKRLNEKFKSFSEYYKAIIIEQENCLKDMKEQQKNIKETYDDNLRQLKFFNDLKKILQIKIETLKTGDVSFGVATNQDKKTNKAGVNRLVIQP